MNRDNLAEIDRLYTIAAYTALKDYAEALEAERARLHRKVYGDAPVSSYTPFSLAKNHAEMATWLDGNTTFFDVVPDGPEASTAGPNIPVLASVSKRIWYHATDNQTDFPFSKVVSAAMKYALPEYAPLPNPVGTKPANAQDNRQRSATTPVSPTPDILPGLNAVSEMFANHECDLFTRSEAIWELMRMTREAQDSASTPITQEKP